MFQKLKERYVLMALEIGNTYYWLWASWVAQWQRTYLSMLEMQVQTLGREDPLKAGMVVVLPGESNGQRSLAGYSPQGRKELDTTEVTENSCIVDCMSWGPLIKYRSKEPGHTDLQAQILWCLHKLCGLTSLHYISGLQVRALYRQCHIYLYGILWLLRRG